MDETIEFNVQFQSEYMAPKPFEMNEILSLWIPQNKELGILEYNIVYREDDEIRKNSETFGIKIPLKYKTKDIKMDECIRFQILTFSRSEMGETVRTNAGCGMLALIDIISENNKNLDKNSIHFTIPIFLRNVRNEKDIPLQKGILTVEIDRSEASKLSNLRFITLDNFDFVQENEELFYNILSSFINRTMTTTTQNIKPSRPELNEIHVPVYEREMGLSPTWTYFLNLQTLQPEEKFFENLFQMELERSRINPQEFIDEIEKYFRTPQEKMSELFFHAGKYYVEALCSIVTALPYKSDSTYIDRRNDKTVSEVEQILQQQKQMRHQETQSDQKQQQQPVEEYMTKHMKIMEAFQDALYYLCGDCEDLAQAIHKLAVLFEKGREEWKVASNDTPWLCNGGYRSRLLSAFQKIAYFYVPICCLSSVTARFLTETENANEAFILPSINSEKYQAAQIGGHMFVIFMPLVQLEKYLKNVDERSTKEIPSTSSPSSAFYQSFKKSVNIFKAKRYDWEQNLVPLCAEGTGMLGTELIPWGDVVGKIPQMSHLKADRKQKQERQIFAIQNIVHGQFLSLGITQMEQFLLEDRDDSAISHFYRMTNHGYTGKFSILYGSNIVEMMFLQMEEPKYRINKSLIEDFAITNSRAAVSFGVYIKDIFYSRNWIGILPVPGYSEIENKLFQSLEKQAPPISNPHYGTSAQWGPLLETNAKEFNSNWEQSIFSFSPSRKDNVIFIHSYFNKYLFVNRPFVLHLISDIKSSLNIASAQTRIEHFTKDICKVRITFAVTPKKTQEEMTDNVPNFIGHQIWRRRPYDRVQIKVKWLAKNRHQKEIQTKHTFDFNREAFAFICGIKNNVAIETAENWNDKQWNIYLDGLRLKTKMSHYIPVFY